MFDLLPIILETKPTSSDGARYVGSKDESVPEGHFVKADLDLIDFAGFIAEQAQRYCQQW